MKIHIYIRKDDLEELHHFLTSSIKYEHRVIFDSVHRKEMLPHEVVDYLQISLNYEDYVSLRDWQMKSTEHPYYPKESRTKKKEDL